MSGCLKCIVWLLMLAKCLPGVYAQNNHWILGVWRGTGITPGSAYHIIFTRTLTVKMELNNRFAGTVTEEVKDKHETRIEKELTGTIVNDKINFRTGRTLYVKQPPTGLWANCGSCKISDTRVSVSSDSLILTNEIRLCGDYCDGFTTYYRSLADFDTLTQRKLVQLFGSPLLVKIFTPVLPIDEKVARSNAAIASTHTLPGPGLSSTPNNIPAVADKQTAAVRDTIQQQLGRKNKTIATYAVTSANIKIELFDNGEIDGDIVTVYHNKQVIINQQLLGLQPIVYTVKADAQNRVHEFILVANNLGRIPPNTALMRITAGTKVYEVFPSTTLSENASVIIIYSGN